MNPQPRYRHQWTVILREVTDKWTLVTYRDEEPDPEADVVLAYDLTTRWNFEDDVVPGQLEPSTLTFSYVARSVEVMPTVEEGQIVSFDFSIHHAEHPAPLIWHWYFRVATVDISLSPGSNYPVRVTVTLSDLLADLASRFPAQKWPNSGVRQAEVRPMAATDWETRLRQIAASIDTTIIRPNWWPAPDLATGPLLSIGWGEESARSVIGSLLASRAPLGHHHTLVPHYNQFWPALDPWPNWTHVQQVPELAPWVLPSQPVGYAAMPAGRGFFRPHGMPYVPVTTGERWTVALDVHPDMLARLPIIDAAWCRGPAHARRSREHAVNVMRIEGEVTKLSTTPDGLDYSGQPGQREVIYATDEGEAPRSRGVKTQLVVRSTTVTAAGEEPRSEAAIVPAIRSAATAHLPDVGARSEIYAWDAFEVELDAMPPAYAARLTPMMFPQAVGIYDDVILRYVLLHSLPEEIRLTGNELGGYMTGATMTISGGPDGGGAVHFTVSTTPGNPQMLASTGALTGADLATNGDPTWADVDPTLTWSRIALTRPND